MRALVCLLLLAMPLFADDWTGKSIQVKEAVKLGRKVGDGLVREGAELDPKKTYAVKSDTGTLLELADGWIFKFEATVAADAKPLPKEKAKETDPAKDKGEWFGKKVMPKRHSSEIRIGDYEDDKPVYWVPHNLLNCTVREDRGGFLRLYDGRREGWVAKDDMVTAEDAPAWWDKEAKANPGSDYGWWMRGIGWLRKKEYDKAISDFTEAIRLDPKSAAAYNNRGLVWANKKENNKAIADYTEAIRLDPKDADAFNNRGLLLVDKKEYDKAIMDYTEAIRLDPKFAMAFHDRGYAMQVKEEFDKAIADYTEAIRFEPKHVDAINNLAWLHATCHDAKIRNGKKAVENGKKLIELNPSWNNRDTLAAAYAENGEFELAVKEQQKAIELLKGEKNPDPKSLKELEARLQLYRDKKPYRDEE